MAFLKIVRRVALGSSCFVPPKKQYQDTGGSTGVRPGLLYAPHCRHSCISWHAGNQLKRRCQNGNASVVMNVIHCLHQLELALHYVAWLAPGVVEFQGRQDSFIPPNVGIAIINNQFLDGLYLP